MNGTLSIHTDSMWEQYGARRMGRASSSPSKLNCGNVLCSTPDEHGLEVYVCSRTLSENGHGGLLYKLPDRLRDSIQNMGLKHYLVVFKSANGTCHQFDFGPIGGDIAIDIPALQVLAEKGEDGKPKRSRGKPGAIREEKIDSDSIPEDRILIGRTRLTLEDIRSYNRSRDTVYDLSRNDCRHYVNGVCDFATGVPHVSRKLVLDLWQQRDNLGNPVSDWMTERGQDLLDVSATPAYDRVGKVTSATALASATTKMLQFVSYKTAWLPTWMPGFTNPLFIATVATVSAMMPVYPPQQASSSAETEAKTRLFPATWSQRKVSTQPREQEDTKPTATDSIKGGLHGGLQGLQTVFFTAAALSRRSLEAARGIVTHSLDNRSVASFYTLKNAQTQRLSGSVSTSGGRGFTVYGGRGHMQGRGQNSRAHPLEICRGAFHKSLHTLRIHADPTVIASHFRRDQKAQSREVVVVTTS